MYIWESFLILPPEARDLQLEQFPWCIQSSHAPSAICQLIRIFSNKAYFVFATHGASDLHNVEKELICHWSLCVYMNIYQSFVYNCVCVYEYIHTKSKYNKIYVENLD